MKVWLAIPWLPTYGMVMLSCFMFLAARAGPGLVPQTIRTSGLKPLILVSCAVMSVSAVLYDSESTICRPIPGASLAISVSPEEPNAFSSWSTAILVALRFLEM